MLGHHGTNRDGRRYVKFSGEQCLLSNFSPSVISLYGITFPTSEHCYQTIKAVLFDDFIQAERILSSSNPRKAKNLSIGQNIRGFDFSTWQAVKLPIMAFVLLQKIAQNKLFRQFFLLEPVDSILAENTGDKYWGIGIKLTPEQDVPKNPPGQNMLGKMWSIIRRILDDPKVSEAIENLSFDNLLKLSTQVCHRIEFVTFPSRSDFNKIYTLSTAQGRSNELIIERTSDLRVKQFPSSSQAPSSSKSSYANVPCTSTQRVSQGRPKEILMNEKQGEKESDGEIECVFSSTLDIADESPVFIICQVGMHVGRAVAFRKKLTKNFAEFPKFVLLENSLLQTVNTFRQQKYFLLGDTVVVKAKSLFVNPEYRGTSFN